MKKFAKAALLGAMMISSVAPAMAATTSPTDDTVFYGDLLNFLKANMSYQGAEYSAFVNSGVFSAADLQKISDAFGQVNAASLTLVQYLQTKITVS